MANQCLRNSVSPTMKKKMLIEQKQWVKFLPIRLAKTKRWIISIFGECEGVETGTIFLECNLVPSKCKCASCVTKPRRLLTIQPTRIMRQWFKHIGTKVQSCIFGDGKNFEIHVSQQGQAKINRGPCAIKQYKLSNEIHLGLLIWKSIQGVVKQKSKL